MHAQSLNMFALGMMMLCISSPILNAFKLTPMKYTSISTRSTSLKMSTPEPEKSGWERLQSAMEEVEKDPKKKGVPPIYEPGPYQVSLLAALAYVIPLVDASDLGKYMFEAYPAVSQIYNGAFGTVAAVYNGVPFLPFAVFFLMSYICRAQSFPVQIRFHFAQAFMVSLIQFVPSILFGFLEKGGVPGMAVAYNTVFLWVLVSCLSMQAILLNPVSSSKNPMLINVVGWAMRYMNYTPDMKPTAK